MFHYLIVGYRIFFVFLYEHLGFALAILLTSLISSFLVKPIARFIMKYVKREQAYEAVLDPLVAEINASDHSGADKQFLLQDLYRRYGYSPIYATRKILPMFVQAPLLFLTYYMLEGATILDGVRFLCFADLGAPDALLPMGINLLPFLMTGINIVAIFATVSFTRQDRIQALIVAMLFLWLLYSANAALMIYWTLNNLFTCLKTLAEEHGEGARLIGRRLAFLFSPANHRKWIRSILNQPSSSYAVAALVCFYMAIYFFVSHKTYTHFRGFLIASCSPLLLSLCILLKAKSSQKRPLFVSSVALFFVFLVGLFWVDCKAFGFLKQVIHPYPGMVLNLQTSVVPLLLILQIVFLCIYWIYSQVQNKGVSLQFQFSGLEFGSFLAFLVSIACHYICANPVLGITGSSFLVFSLYLIGVFVSLSLLGVLLFVRELSPRMVARVAFLFSSIFFLMPLFAKESGWFSPEKNHWLFLVLATGIGIAFHYLWTKKTRATPVFLILLSVGLLIGAAHNYVEKVVKERAAFSHSSGDGPAQQESFSKLDGHTVSNPINIYVFVYDGWPNATIGDYYDVPNPLPELEKLGFTAYPHSFMPECHTDRNMSHFFDIFNDANGTMADLITGSAKMLRFLKHHNYHMEYFGDTLSLAKHTQPIEWDVLFPQKLTTIESVLFKGILQGIFSTSGTALKSVTDQERKDATLAALSQKADRPIFMYSHNGPLHLPWGKPQKRSFDESQLEIHRSTMAFAYEEMFDFLRVVPDWDNSLIVVMSDHGLGLMQSDNTSEATKFLNYNANMLAVKWPKGYEPVMDVSFGPNVMLEAMICITGDQELARFKQNSYLYKFDHLDVFVDKDEHEPFENGIMLEGPNKGRDLFEVGVEELNQRFQGKSK